METMPYTILKSSRVVRVKYSGLKKPWRLRGGYSPWETDMREIELVLRQATGLRRMYRRHNILFGYVDFVLSPRAFGPGAIGLAMTYAEDEFWGPRLRAYPGLTAGH